MITHAGFTLERIYDASPERVFAQFADRDLKEKWFSGPPDWTTVAGELDFRVGGHEVDAGGPPGGPVHWFKATYYDIVDNERIVYAYEMYLDDHRISVSLSTIELEPVGNGTRLVLTEQGAFFDGHDDPSAREAGTKEMLELLAAALDG